MSRSKRLNQQQNDELNRNLNAISPKSQPNFNKSYIYNSEWILFVISRVIAPPSEYYLIGYDHCECKYAKTCDYCFTKLTQKLK